MRRVLASVPCLNLSLTGVFYPVLALAGGVPSGCSSQGRQRAEALAERSVEIAQAMVPLAGALARGVVRDYRGGNVISTFGLSEF